MSHWMVVAGLATSLTAFSVAGELHGANASGAAPPAAEAGAAVAQRSPDLWGVQLAGSFSLKQAESMFERVRQAIPDLLDGLEPTIIMTPLGNRGPQKLYRLRIQTMSRADATQLCRTIRDRGEDCVVLPSSR